MKHVSRTKFLGKGEWNAAEEKEAQDGLHVGRHG